MAIRTPSGCRAYKRSPSNSRSGGAPSAQRCGLSARNEPFSTWYQRASERLDTRVLRDVELKCDGIATLTLVELGLDPRVLTSAARKLTRFNEKQGATANLSSYPSPLERERFVLAVLALRAHSKSNR